MNRNKSIDNRGNQEFNKKAETLSVVDPLRLPVVEEWVVNSVKLSLVKRLDAYLDNNGRDNLRKLFLVPIFSIQELSAHIQETAPEMKTFYYKELMKRIEEAGTRLNHSERIE